MEIDECFSISITRDRYTDYSKSFSKSSPEQGTNFPSSFKHRLLSSQIFDISTNPNELLLALQYFRTKIDDEKAAKRPGRKIKDTLQWGQADIESVGRLLVSVCEAAVEILLQEPRLLQLETPVYIMGDLHGNFKDLIFFEKVFWNLGPSMIAPKLLFLGDYVDKGPFGVEIVAYLFAHKVKDPNKVYLLRGNHEITTVQNMFTFHAECVSKFGELLGQRVWEAVNRVFDVMPLAAVLDHKVFCVHSGIPPPWLCPTIESINMIPAPLTDCEEQSPLAWGLIWNDPVQEEDMKPYCLMELEANEGFIANLKRGTGHLFSSGALERFLKTNNLSHVVRTHDVAQGGFHLKQKGKLLTVFSTSNYSGGSNFAACILAADRTLRIFSIDTSETEE